MRKLMNLVNDERGIQHAEEALLLALIAVAAIGAAKTLGAGVNSTFAQTSNCIDNSATTTCP